MLATRESRDDRRHENQQENQEMIDSTTTDNRYSRGDRRHNNWYEENTNRRKAQIEKIFEETAAKLNNHRYGTEGIEETNQIKS